MRFQGSLTDEWKNLSRDRKEQEVKNVSISGVRVSFLRSEELENQALGKVVGGCDNVISKVGIVGVPAPLQPCESFLIRLYVVGLPFH